MNEEVLALLLASLNTKVKPIAFLLLLNDTLEHSSRVTTLNSLVNDAPHQHLQRVDHMKQHFRDLNRNYSYILTFLLDFEFAELVGIVEPWATAAYAAENPNAVIEI